MATDRESLAERTLKGYASPALGGMVPPDVPGHSERIGLAYDPETARQLLGQAGYSGGQHLAPIAFRAPADMRVEAEILISQWEKHLNLHFELETMDWETLFNLGPGTSQLEYWSWGGDYFDPDDFLRMGIRLLPRWHSETYAGLIQNATSTTRQSDRIVLYQEADRILIEEAGLIPITYPRRHLLVKPWVIIPARRQRLKFITIESS